ncbi:2Fe-2S iron-sulfur cluster binding domain protein [Marinomonas spartinae]|uniref:2Fe-2S iron-sulfur cluster binding domain protein n=2 Tax=Marinomonas spartinae TaxID=1792290 RepID=A0A1A8TPN9_9GAMM|nr:2Fe-2S iron-sulfur cluster binding domain protein [Marinomonas spartinae]
MSMDASSVTIQVDDQSFQAEVGDNLLTSCLSHHVDMNFSCRAGVCGACALYDETSNRTILSCQSSVSEPLILSRHLPSQEDLFRVLERRFLDETAVELVLLGPSDDAFGDFVELQLSDANKTTIECMALNSAGEPLVLLLSKRDVNASQWSLITNSEINSFVVRTRLGERKGRLLTEFDLVERSVWLICDSATEHFSPYWETALGSVGANFLGRSVFTANNSLSENSPLFQEELAIAFNAINTSNIEIIIQAAGLTQEEWNQLLSAFYIRPNQIHIVRLPH